MMTFLAIENAEAIILDPKSKTYDGPRDLFRMVGDGFDGKIIRSWHIKAIVEDSWSPAPTG
jgi:hypothetical protein